MVSRLLALILVALPIFATDNEEWRRRQANPDNIKSSLADLARLNKIDDGPYDYNNGGKQTKAIKDAKPDLRHEALLLFYEYSNQKKEFIDAIPKDKIPDLSYETLLEFYNKSTQQNEFIERVLRSKFTKEERQELINRLLESFSYSDLLINLSSEECAELGDRANPFYVGTMPIVDWLNTTHFDSFFSPIMTNTLVNREFHNEFDSFNHWDLWFEPFGFYTKFRRDGDHLQFNQYTIGLKVGGEYTFFDRLIFGLGMAYSHSGIDWQKKPGHAGVDSLYFGPALNYVFSDGYVGCTLFGVANFYQIDRDTKLFDKIRKPKKANTNYMSWDLVMRVEGGLSYAPGDQFYLNPTIRIDYLNVFEQKSSEQLDEGVALLVDGYNESFLSSRIGLELSREFYQPALGFLIPSLSIGWIRFTPLSIKDYNFHLEECGNLKKKIEVKTWNQYYFGTSFSIVHKKAILFSLDYEFVAGANSPLQAGSLRLELSW